MKKFNHPYVVGIVGKTLNNRKHLLLRNKFNSVFKKKKLPFVYLLLKVEPKYLKNIITCMRLMDVIGVNVFKNYEKKVTPFLDSLDKSARIAKKVNVIAKKDRRFIGYHFDKNLVKASINLWKCLVN